MPRGNPISVNSRVLLFTFALALLTILIFGLLPALQAAKADVRESLNEGGRSGIGSRKQGRMRRLLVIAEVALALVLLVASGLMVRSFIKLRHGRRGLYRAQCVNPARPPAGGKVSGAQNGR